MTEVLIVGIYFIGVLLALVLIAWLNAKYGFDICPELSLGSWFSIIAYIIIYATAPFGKLYDWLYNKFERHEKTNSMEDTQP